MSYDSADWEQLDDNLRRRWNEEQDLLQQDKDYHNWLNRLEDLYGTTRKG